MAADWQPDEPLADPMCGSGTFGIEGALMALDAAPGKNNTPPVVGFPAFQAKLWQKLQREAQESRSTSELGDLWIRSGDRDAGAVKASRQNATRAGVEALVSYRQAPLDTPLEQLPEDGLVVVNPPWGHRISDHKKLSGLYLGLGKGLANSYPGWRVAVVCPDKALAGRLGKGMEQVAKFSAGGIKVGVWLGEIPTQ
jgi:putative N6-adenine-specific DNA methylase